VVTGAPQRRPSLLTDTENRPMVPVAALRSGRYVKPDTLLWACMSIVRARAHRVNAFGCA
jgi:hypothetical protein